MIGEAADVANGIWYAAEGNSLDAALSLGPPGAGRRRAGFPHGVSVTTPAQNARLSQDPTDASFATRRQLEEAGFTVHHTPTRRDPFHHSVELPKPVTPEAARLFNEVFGRTRR